jgi:hypothetical protein
LDLLTGANFVLFFSFYKTNASFLLLLALTLAGGGLGLGILLYYYRQVGHRNNKVPPVNSVISKNKAYQTYYDTLRVVFLLYITECVLFYKIHLMDTDMAVEFSLFPFLVLLCFVLPQHISFPDYERVSRWSVTVLSIVFLVTTLTISAAEFTDPLRPMPEWLIFFCVLWFVLDVGLKSILFVLFYLYTVLTVPFLARVLWQADSVQLNIIQGLVLCYTCMIYSVRLRDYLRELLSPYQVEHPIMWHILLHLLIYCLVFTYMDWVAPVAGYGSIVLGVFRIFTMFF